MEFFAEHGSASAGWAGAIRGAGAGTIPFRRGTSTENIPPARPSQLFVNSPAGDVYGLTSMDCHYALCLRADRVVRLHRYAFAGAGPGRGRSVTIPHRG